MTTPLWIYFLFYWWAFRLFPIFWHCAVAMNNFYIHCFISIPFLATFFSVILPPIYSATIKAVSEDTSQAKFNAVHILRSAQCILSHLNKNPNDTHQACTAPDDHASAQFCPHPMPFSSPSPHISLLCLANLQDYCPWDNAPAFGGYFLLVRHTDVFLPSGLIVLPWCAGTCLTTSSLGKGSHGL